jgi:hypothetical protein
VYVITTMESEGSVACLLWHGTDPIEAGRRMERLRREMGWNDAAWITASKRNAGHPYPEPQLVAVWDCREAEVAWLWFLS